MLDKVKVNRSKTHFNKLENIREVGYLNNHQTLAESALMSNGGWGMSALVTGGINVEQGLDPFGMWIWSVLS